MRQQGKVLKHHAHLVAADFDQLAGAGFQKVFAVEINATRCWLDEAR